MSKLNTKEMKYYRREKEEERFDLFGNTIPVFKRMMEESIMPS